MLEKWKIQGFHGFPDNQRALLSVSHLLKVPNIIETKAFILLKFFSNSNTLLITCNIVYIVQGKSDVKHD